MARLFDLLRTAALLPLLWSVSTIAQGESIAKRECRLGQANSVFAPHRWPTQTLDRFASGQLGILDPRFDHFYLFMAYRSLTGQALGAADLNLMRASDPCWNDGGRTYHGYDKTGSHAAQEASEKWLSALREAGKAGGDMAHAAQAAQASRFDGPNCNPDALRTAARTLQDRVEAHGSTHPSVAEWVRGQTSVFALCGGVVAEGPPAVGADAPAWLRADRAYQQAAAHLYAGRFAQSVQLFDAIAADAQSPWQVLAPYLAARTALRAYMEGALVASLDEVKARLLGAQRLARGNPGLSADIARLLQWVRLRLEPTQMQEELDLRLSQRDLPATSPQDLRDFDPSTRGQASFDARTPGFGGWITALRFGLDRVFPEGHGAPETDLWLVAALTQAREGQADLLKLLQRAAAVPKEAPAYLTAQYHRIRLIKDSKQALSLARGLLRLPADRLTIADRNRLREVASRHVQSAREFAEFSIRQAIEPDAAADFPRLVGAPVVDMRAADTLNNRMPLRALHGLLRDAATPKPLRDELLSMVWVRALLLQRWDVLHDLVPLMKGRWPSLEVQLQALDGVQDPRERQALGALLLAQHPGWVGSIGAVFHYTSRDQVTELAMPNMHRYFAEEGSRMNWWCRFPNERFYDLEQQPVVPNPADFLSKPERDEHRSEVAVLSALPNATEYVGNLVLPWAQQHAKDPRLPGVLRMLVRSARGGCVGPGAKDIGRLAFRHLHRHFPRSEAARLTRSHG